jgi:metallo-beta-lactamase family protein
MLGREVEVRATIETLDGLSAHADQQEILRWLRGFRRAPRHTYLVHAEATAADALQGIIGHELGWSVRPAKDGETVSL